MFLHSLQCWLSVLVASGEEKTCQDLQKMQPQVLWTLHEGLEKRWDNKIPLTLRNQPAGVTSSWWE